MTSSREADNLSDWNRNCVRSTPSTPLTLTRCFDTSAVSGAPARGLGLRFSALPSRFQSAKQWTRPSSSVAMALFRSHFGSHRNALWGGAFCKCGHAYPLPIRADARQAGYSWVTMARKKHAKRRTATSKRPPKARALRADGGHVRRAVAAPRSAESTALPMAEVMGRAMAAYAELPVRLLACTSPVQFWAEYLRFGQRLFSGFLAVSHATRPAPTSGARIAQKAARR